MCYRTIFRHRSCIIYQKSSCLWQMETSTNFLKHKKLRNIPRTIYNIHAALYSVCSVCYKTHYETLGIEQNATQKEIKEAYIKLGKELHPDLHRNSENNQDSTQTNEEKDLYTAQFKSLNEAYSVLSKPHSRRIYDLGLPGQPNKYSKNHGYESYGDTFEERAERMHGYKVDPNYWNEESKSNRWRIVFFCFIWAVFGGSIIQIIIQLARNKQAKILDERTLSSQRHLDQIQKISLNKDSLKDKNSKDYAQLLEKIKSGNISTSKDVPEKNPSDMT